ncbi:3-hydroxyacyl-CoA dehydrogenase [Govanella unica]|uniref:3-hydroxyacyl-CoA dehydrogenase n=1 Tax=Govanella unica TaxID=2975056 RepID=A0A9X3TX92_9PROT|nr:3-hydroxyacyl-CoA dehydrogenase [Govania unica]MDA5193423.1 3-hydroxyacyl-CoA dehydrogenase [Govania unica]
MERIGILGAGAMGRGIAQIAAAAGYPVIIADANPKAAEDALGFISDLLKRAADKGRMTAEAADAAIKNITVAQGVAAFKDCTLVVEAIIERLDIKRQVFAELEGIVSADCILASNTSSLSVTSIAAGAKLPGRIAGYHFFNPVPLMKVVEVVKATLTEDWVVDRLVTLSKAVGHKPVVTADTPGFIVNHAGRAFGTEGLRILGEGIAATHDIDDVMREGAGFRMGPFELMDLTGLDVSQTVMESVYRQFYDDPKYRPSALAANQMAAGLYGRKTKRGFYVYENGEQQRPAPRPVPTELPKTVWAEGADEKFRVLLGELAAKAGVTVESGAKPSATAIAFVTPVGQDATTSAAELGLDATRVVAVDALFGLATRRTLMTTPVTDPALRDQAHALLASDGVAVTVIHDSPGFIAQRIVAMIVNIASDIAQQRIATPADIETAVKLGLGYPKGPLEFGDHLGAATVQRILDAMFAFYGDPRYRSSPWLKRRAMLGVSLMTAEG